MKKLVVFLLITSMVFSMTAVNAEDLEIQVINPNVGQYDSLSLDNCQLGKKYTIDGYADVYFAEYSVFDYFAQFGEAEDYGTRNRFDGDIWQVWSYSDSRFDWGGFRFKDASWMQSGNDGQFIWLRVDITNRQKKPVNFTEEAQIKVVYLDDYEFKGWIRQIDNDYISRDTSDYGVSRLGGDKKDYPNAIVLNPKKTHAIDMMYAGHYVIGCTVPNVVVEDKKAPLRIEIKLGENELTYYINK